MSTAKHKVQTLPIIMGGVVVAGVVGGGYLFRKELGFGPKPPPPPPPKVVETNEVAEVEIPVNDVDVGGITVNGIFYVPVATQSEVMKREAAEKKAAEDAAKN